MSEKEKVKPLEGVLITREGGKLVKVEKVPLYPETIVKATTVDGEVVFVGTVKHAEMLGFVIAECLPLHDDDRARYEALTRN